MEHLVIAGAGAMGRELYWNAISSKGYNKTFDIKGYIDDMADEAQENLQKPLLGSIDEYKIQKEDVFICAIGNTKARENVVEKLKKKEAKFLSLIHNTAILQGNISFGTGIYLGPFTVIGDHACLGDHVMLNTHSAIGHDAIIGEYTCIMSYVDITGGCKLGKRVFLGSGSRMVPNSKIGDDAYIGVGSVVLRRVQEGKKVFGNPAKIYEI